MNSTSSKHLLYSKLPKVKETIFTVMSKLATEHRAINLSQGYPDFSCSTELVELVNSYMKKGFNQYAPMPGVLKLREKIAQLVKETYNSEYDPNSEITITAGATEALFVAISSVITPGDEVIIFEPAFDSYEPCITLNGGVCKYIPLSFPDFKIDWNKVKEVVSERTKLIIINSPHNPSGAILTNDDLKKLAQILENTSAFIIADEVYEHIIFDGNRHHSATTNEVLKERAFVISSFGKTFHVTGWRIGYCLAPKELTSEFRKIHQYLVFGTSTPMQWALADFLDNKANITGLSKFYEGKRDKFRNLMSSSRFKFLPCSGSFFQLLQYKDISEENDLDMAIRLIKEVGVASIPISGFYHQKDDNKVLRFCFAKEDSTLEAAAEKLCKI